MIRNSRRRASGSTGSRVHQLNTGGTTSCWMFGKLQLHRRPPPSPRPSGTRRARPRVHEGARPDHFVVGAGAPRMRLNHANHRRQPIPAWLVDPPQRVCGSTASRGTGTSSGSVSRSPRTDEGHERRLQLTTTTIATNAINDGSTRVICVPSPGPFPALGRAIMAQRDASCDCVDGSSWSAAIGRRATSVWARVSRPVRE